MIRCKKCGTLNQSDAAFCGQCDAYLEWSGEKVDDEGEPLASSPPAAASPPPGTPPPPAATPLGPPGVPGAVPPARPAARPASEATPPASRAGEPKSRQPEKGATEPQRKAKPPQRTKPQKPKPGQRVCANCGSGNDPGRKFCRQCGSGLDLAPLEPPTPESRRGPSLLSRLFRRGKQEAYMAGQRPESMLSAPSRWRPGSSAMVFGLLAAVGLGSLASYWYMPEVRNGVDDVVRMVQNQIGGRARVNVTNATGRSRPGFPALNVIDGGSNTYWVGPRGAGGRWQIDFELQRPSDLLQLNLDSGADGEQFEKLGRPFEIQLRADGELSPVYELKDTKDQQVVHIDIQDVRELRLIVRSQYRGLDGGTDIAIREVAFFGPQ